MPGQSRPASRRGVRRRACGPGRRVRTRHHRRSVTAQPDDGPRRRTAPGQEREASDSEQDRKAEEQLGDDIRGGLGLHQEPGSGHEHTTAGHERGRPGIQRRRGTLKVFHHDCHGLVQALPARARAFFDPAHQGVQRSDRVIFPGPAEPYAPGERSHPSTIATPAASAHLRMLLPRQPDRDRRRRHANHRAAATVGLPEIGHHMRRGHHCRHAQITHIRIHT